MHYYNKGLFLNKYIILYSFECVEEKKYYKSSWGNQKKKNFILIKITCFEMGEKQAGRGKNKFLSNLY